ncbi:O-antigen ligase family protein [Thalassospira lucentensis]|uniref:O-antigen ligase family protein n=1 Tax=Thalassospira lucentensis TaxID=168935 RepID=UPI00142E76AA|nr:O-antigen ligase family protein [Thalassospira lucentensis]NIZ01770.1 hypothetical protein [Thalassospira lucentensis]
MIKQLAKWDSQWGIYHMLVAQICLMAAVVALSLLALTQRDIALVFCGVLFFLIALAFPRLGLTFLIMITPIQGLWGLSRADMPLLLGTLMAAVNLRHAPLWLTLLHSRTWKRLPTLLLVLAAFVVLFIVWSLFTLSTLPQQQTDSTFMACAFVIFLFGAALAIFHHCLTENGNSMRLGLISAVSLALMLTISFDVISVYFPKLSNFLQLLPEWPGLRLSGLHSNPNATAKYFLAGLAIALAVCWQLFGCNGTIHPPRSKNRFAKLLAASTIAIIFAIVISATSSKGSLIAAVLAPMAAAIAFWSSSKRASLFAIASAMVIAIVTMSYTLVLATDIGQWTYEQYRQAEHIPKPVSPEKPSPNVLERMKQQLRLSRSHEMIVVTPSKDKPQKHSQIYRNIDGDIKYKNQECKSLICTGQRNRLWSIGLDIWADNWILGIGPTNWPNEYFQRTQFPFDSPHNVLIELGGGLGIAGLGLYGFFLVAMWRLWRTTFSQPKDNNAVASVFAQGAVLYAIALMLTETVDPAKFFAINPHSIWVWLFLAGTVMPRSEQAAKFTATSTTEKQ